jgi:hypothetical protein
MTYDPTTLKSITTTEFLSKESFVRNKNLGIVLGAETGRKTTEVHNITETIIKGQR